MEEEVRPIQHPTILKVWTDGAMKDSPKMKVLGMAAVVCYRGGGKTVAHQVKSWRVEAKKTSSMHAELFAIQCALESIPLEQKKTCTIIVISDCLDAVQAIKNSKITTRYQGLVRHIQNLLNSFPKANVVWCKAHSGHKWNELANQVAQKTAGTWNPYPKIPDRRVRHEHNFNKKP